MMSSPGSGGVLPLDWLHIRRIVATAPAGEGSHKGHRQGDRKASQLQFSALHSLLVCEGGGMSGECEE